MAAVKDFKIDESNDIVFFNGDLYITESDGQHVKNNVEAAPGHYKEFPLRGADIERFMNSVGFEQQIEAAIRLTLESDGYRVNLIEISDKIYIDAERI